MVHWKNICTEDSYMEESCSGESHIRQVVSKALEGDRTKIRGWGVLYLKAWVSQLHYLLVCVGNGSGGEILSPQMLPESLQRS